jgi:hypothetical protein
MSHACTDVVERNAVCMCQLETVEGGTNQDMERKGWCQRPNRRHHRSEAVSHLDFAQTRSFWKVCGEESGDVEKWMTPWKQGR